MVLGKRPARLLSPAESCAPFFMAKYLPQQTAFRPVSALSPARCSRLPRSTVLRPYGAPGPKETPPPTPCLADTRRATDSSQRRLHSPPRGKEKGAVRATQQGVGGRPPGGQTPGFWPPQRFWRTARSQAPSFPGPRPGPWEVACASARRTTRAQRTRSGQGSGSVSARMSRTRGARAKAQSLELGQRRKRGGSGQPGWGQRRGGAGPGCGPARPPPQAGTRRRSPRIFL